MQNGMDTLEDSMAISYKLNILLPYYPVIVLKGLENLCPHKNLDMFVYISFIYNC